MGYVENNLMRDEKIVYQAKPHWIIFAWPAVSAVLGLFLLPQSAQAGSFFLVLSVLLSINPLAQYFTSEFAVTNKRVLVKVGFISRHTLELLLTKVETIGVDQSILGRILGYGTLVVIGTGGTREPFKAIVNPLEFRHQVQGQTPV
ncbi:MAG: PH domain-containing protein [Deltaproteobacteria bacterium]|nr:PH domain-containing protein [Deltaproteobacteria bacterium]